MITRRQLLYGSAAAALAADQSRMTYDYKGTIKADVYRPGGDAVRPVLVWIHGGALIMGNREGIDRRVKEWAAAQGYVLVSIDYRLAPETKMPEIVADVEDAFRWVRSEGPRLFHGDPKKLAVAGGSAGGYLTLTTGFRVKPKPTVLLSLWGYGDLIGDWYSTPSPHKRHHAITMSREEAYKQVSGPPVSDARDRKGDGSAFYQHCRQTGTWPTAVTGGWDPKRDAAKFYAYMPVKHVTKDYPPTVMIHGTADTDVPYEQSVMMAREFARHGVRHELLTVPNGEHGLSGTDPHFVEDAYQKAFAFVEREMAR